MSRIGRMPIPVPKEVEVQVTAQGNLVTVQGPKGRLSQAFHPEMQIALKDGQLVVSRPSDARQHRALHGLTRSLLANMVLGVSKGFQKTLEIVGVGYRAQMAGNKLVLQVGLSRPVEVEPPPGITLATEGANRVLVQGTDKQLVGEVAAKVRAIRLPDPYKGKGIRYAGERVRLKPGKTAAKKK